MAVLTCKRKYPRLLTGNALSNTCQKFNSAVVYRQAYIIDWVNHFSVLL